MKHVNLDKIYIMAIGDGYITKSNKLCIEHGSKQKDFLTWKRNLLNNEFNLDLKIYNRQKILNGKVFQNYNFGCSLNKRFGLSEIRKEIYGKGKKKNYLKILNKIKDIDLLLSIWFGDDGSVSRRTTGETVNSAWLCLFTLDQTKEENEKLQLWFKEKVNVDARIRTMKTKENKILYFLSFGQPDSMIIWNRIRKTFCSVDSMKHKFRHIEQKYLRSFSYLEYNPSERPQRPKNQKITLDEIGITKEQLVSSYDELKSSYKVATKYGTSATAVKRLLKEAGAIRAQSQNCGISVENIV